MRAYIAEFVGTFILAIAACGCAVLAGGHVGDLEHDSLRLRRES
jgi:glycerol uptake facilitator-like aquaporin